MRDVLRKIGPALREIGFRGTSQNYRKVDDDFIFVINFQGSNWGPNFYVNLGAQPTFIPDEGMPDPKKLNEYQCVLRRRVGSEWPWDLSDDRFESLKDELMTTQATFFGHARTLRSALSTEAPAVLLKKFGAGATDVRAALFLARAALAVGDAAVARALAERGVELVGDIPGGIADELRKIASSGNA